MKGEIFSVKRFAVHDGDGIRTTLFLKGCSLKCEWCHNPEGIKTGPQLAYYPARCINCGECAAVCPSSAHKMENEKHVFNRSLCTGCGECEGVCLGEALSFYGRLVTPQEILPELLADRDFYKANGGGVTLSGGECLCQDDFCAELLRLLKEEDINTALDTCGNIPRSSFDKVIPFTDTFLYDIKAADPALHRALTGYDNALILDNLKYLDSRSCGIEIRIPYIPERNSGEIAAIGALLSPLKSIKRVKLLGYHNYAGPKYDALGMENTLSDVPLPGAAELNEAADILRSFGLDVTF